MMSNSEQINTLLFQLFFKDFDEIIDENIEYCEKTKQNNKDLNLQIENNNELNDDSRKKALENGKKYDLYLLYEFKFYTFLKNKDIDKCLKIIKLMYPVLSQILDDCDYLSDKQGGLNNQEYLRTMNALKKKYDKMIEYEKIFHFMKDIQKSVL